MGKPLSDNGLRYGLSRVEVGVHVLYFDRLPRFGNGEGVKYADVVSGPPAIFAAEHEDVSDWHTARIQAEAVPVKGGGLDFFGVVTQGSLLFCVIFCTVLVPQYRRLRTHFRACESGLGKYAFHHTNHPHGQWVVHYGHAPEILDIRLPQPTGLR